MTTHPTTPTSHRPADWRCVERGCAVVVHLPDAEVTLDVRVDGTTSTSELGRALLGRRPGELVAYDAVGGASRALLVAVR